MKHPFNDDGGDRFSLKIGFSTFTNPIDKYPIVWPSFKPRPPVAPDVLYPDISGYTIDWWDRLHIGKIIPDTTLWCNTYHVSYVEDVTEYADDGVITDIEYKIDGEWYTGEQVGWMYLLFVVANVLFLGQLQDFWSKRWKRTFEGFYNARRYIEVTEYRWQRNVEITTTIDCEGVITEYSKEYYPSVRPPDVVGVKTTVTQEFSGNVNEGDPLPTSDSWIGTAVNNVGELVDWGANNGKPFGIGVTVSSPTSTVIEPLTVLNESETNPIIAEDSPLHLPKIEELLTSYQMIIELDDPDGATAIAAYPSQTQQSNVQVALKGSYVAGPYSHPGYTIDELRAMQAAGTPISRDEFRSTFGIILPEGVSECIITSIDIDTDTQAGSLFGDTTYRPGIYVGSPTDKVYYPSNAQEGTITVRHR